MANRTIAEQIAVLEARRTVLEAALTATSGGTASFSVDGLQQSYSNPAAISAELTKVEKSLQRLYRGGRGMPVDMSAAATGSGSVDPYRSGSEVLL
jgi:hypothetical protein